MPWRGSASVASRSSSPRKTLENVIGGVFIIFDRAVGVGDLLKSYDCPLCACRLRCSISSSHISRAQSVLVQRPADQTGRKSLTLESIGAVVWIVVDES